MQKTVLIVEDEYLIACDIQLLVESDGWQVIGPAASVSEALSLIRQELPHVALLDVNLGKEFVTPVALALKDKGIPFAVASAYPKPELYGGEVLSGVPNVGKPASDRSILAALALLVDAAR